MSRTSLYTVALRFPSLELRDPDLFQYGNATVHNARFIKTWCGKVDVRELEWPAQSPV